MALICFLILVLFLMLAAVGWKGLLVCLLLHIVFVPLVFYLSHKLGEWKRRRMRRKKKKRDRRG